MGTVYKPFGIIASVLGGIIAGKIFKKIWALVAHEDDKPDAKDKQRSWAEVVISAAFQGAVFGVVKALVDRAGATGFERATGVWPGNSDPIEKRK